MSCYGSYLTIARVLLKIRRGNVENDCSSYFDFYTVSVCTYGKNQGIFISTC